MDTHQDYLVIYYTNQKGEKPVEEYILVLQRKERAKILSYINLLRDSQGYLEEPYSRHITGKIRELRVDFAHNRHRVFYFATVGKRIVLLHAFFKTDFQNTRERDCKSP
mgnify:CR=1